MNPETASDPLGYGLLQERVQRAQRLVTRFAKGRHRHRGVDFDSWLGGCRRILVTGVGSSEANAKYLTYLLNQSPNISVEFRPLYRFIDGAGDLRGAHVIVFSQGLSPNAKIVMNRAEEFESLTVFCSTEALTVRKMPQDASKAKRLEIVEYIPELERSLLIRVMGPLAAYVAAYRWAAERVAEIPPVPALLAKRLEQSEDRGAKGTKILDAAASEPLSIIAASPVAGFCQNLAYKMMEGVFAPYPAIWDGLQVAHGPFQQLGSCKGGIILLSDSKTMLGRRIDKLLVPLRNRTWKIETPLPAIFAIFEYEMIFNYFLLELLKVRACNQRDWPLHGLDGAIYNIDRL